MLNDFVLQVKFTIFWLNRGLRVYLDLYSSDFPKSTSQYFLNPSTFKSQTTYFGGFFGKRNHPNHVKYMLAKKRESFVKNIFNIMSLDKFEWLSSSEKFFIQILNPQIKHCCDAPRSMLSYYFGKIQVLRDNFGEIWRIQIQIYHQTSIGTKDGAFYLKDEVSAHGLVLLVQLSWRVAPPLFN